MSENLTDHQKYRLDQVCKLLDVASSLVGEVFRELPDGDMKFWLDRCIHDIAGSWQVIDHYLINKEQFDKERGIDDNDGTERAISELAEVIKTTDNPRLALKAAKMMNYLAHRI